MQVKHADNMSSKIKENLIKTTDIAFQPRKQTLINIKAQVYTENVVTGKNQPSHDLQDNDDFNILPSLTTTQNRQFTELINNFLEHPYTLKKGCHISTSPILIPEQVKLVKPVIPAPLHHLVNINQDDAI